MGMGRSLRPCLGTTIAPRRRSIILKRVLKIIVVHGVIFASLGDYLEARLGAGEAAALFRDEPHYLLTESYPDERLVALLSREHGLPSVDVRAYSVSREVLALVPAHVARKHEVLPLNRTETALMLAMACGAGKGPTNEAGGPAGIKVGAVIAEINKKPVRNLEDFGRLMADLFVALGYEQPRLNVHKSGRELDLSADHRLEPRRAIAECKATAEPIGGDNLNKFVGVLNAERQDKRPVTGYFISLAGFRETAIEQEKNRRAGDLVILHRARLAAHELVARAALGLRNFGGNGNGHEEDCEDRRSHTTLMVALCVAEKPLSPVQRNSSVPLSVARVLKVMSGFAAIAGCRSARKISTPL